MIRLLHFVEQQRYAALISHCRSHTDLSCDRHHICLVLDGYLTNFDNDLNYFDTDVENVMADVFCKWTQLSLILMLKYYQLWQRLGQ